ncbi:MAG: transcription termination factor Rho [Caldilineaceae bacterium]|nr:transcription termination factor Rho [Caldilineaceae bacterium]
MTNQVTGVFQALKQGGGFLRDPDVSFQALADDPWVSNKLIQEHGLVNGATVTGTVRRAKQGIQLATVATVCGLSPATFKARPKFERLTAIDPNERFQVGNNGNISMRVIELLAPIGKGTRGLIVAPPKAGKTQLLEALAAAIHAENPETRIVALLVDERPEEVTHFKRNVQAEVLASSNDQGIEAHVNLAELTMAHICVELECGRDVVVLIDSLTRLGRAYNLHGAGARRTMSGGIDAKALEMPRRFFGLARNIENGGSVTVIATALIETGSRMDDYIYEEFKSTGNSEIVLDRELAEARIYPAINIPASGTRKEELLYSADEIARLASLRRWLASGSPQAAMRGLLKLIDQTPDNETLVKALNPAYAVDKNSSSQGASPTTEKSGPATKSTTRTSAKKAAEKQPTERKRRIPSAVAPRARRAKPKNPKE